MNETYVCPSSQFHDSIDELVDEAEAEDIIGLSRDELRGMVLQLMLSLLIPAGSA